MYVFPCCKCHIFFVSVSWDFDFSAGHCMNPVKTSLHSKFNQDISVKLHLLIIAKEDLDRQPSITADLEALRHRIQMLNLIIRQRPAVKLIV